VRTCIAGVYVKTGVAYADVGSDDSRLADDVIKKKKNCQPNIIVIMVAI
jgi:tRNA A22 N-methylase